MHAETLVVVVDIDVETGVVEVVVVEGVITITCVTVVTPAEGVETMVVVTVCTDLEVATDAAETAADVVIVVVDADWPSVVAPVVTVAVGRVVVVVLVPT